MQRLIPVETRLRLIAARAGLPWAEARELSFADFARRCAMRSRPRLVRSDGGHR